MVTPKPEFRPNPERAIYVQGEINAELVQFLTPKILQLKQSPEPITVYIDSMGGSIYHMRAISRLLHAKSQDFVKPHIITVATHHAYSAAAALLCAGSYVLAYPESTVLFHGGRFLYEQAELTAERATKLTRLLTISDEQSVKETLQGIQFRFLLRFIIAGTQFAKIREAVSDPDMSNLDCFLTLISRFLSETALEIIEEAKNRSSRYEELLAAVEAAVASLPPNTPQLQIEAEQIKAIVDFEVRLNRDSAQWSFHSEGIDSLFSDFLLFQQAQAISENTLFSNWVSMVGQLLVTQEQKDELAKIENEEQRTARLLEIINTLLQPTRSFFVALCYILHRGENQSLTARDAFWLGLIDEVIGDAALSPFRLMAEETSDDTQETPEIATAATE